METSTQTKPQPVVGEFATYTIGSDSYPVEIIAISKGKNKIVVRDAEVVNSGALPGDADYAGVKEGTYVVISKAQGQTRDFHLNQHGRYQGRGGSGTLSFGAARYYRDPSF